MVTTAEINLAEASLTGLSSPNLVIKANHMKEDQTYTFLLAVAKASGELIVNYPKIN